MSTKVPSRDAARAAEAGAPGTAGSAPASGQLIYTCPMHPEVQQDHPGDCPKCGMTLEPRTVTAEAGGENNAELQDMTRRFWIDAALALPVLVLAMAHLVPALAKSLRADGQASRWTQLILTTPVVWWAGWPFFMDIKATIASRKLYKSKSKNFDNVLRRTISTAKGIKRVGRGVYAVK